MSVRPNGDGSVTYTGPSGLTGVFTLKSGSTTDYDAPKGFTVDLTKTSPGWTMKDHQSQSKQKFGTDGSLVSREDRDDNVTQVNATGGYGVSPTIDIVAPAGPVGSRTIQVATDVYDTTTMTQATPTDTRRVSFTRTNGNLASFVDPLGRTTTFGYSVTGLLTSIDAPGEVDTEFGYDTSGRVTSIAQAETSGSGPGTSVTRLAYVSATETQLASPATDQTQPVGSVPHTTYTLNGSKRVEKAVDAMDRERSKKYTANFDTASSSTGLAASGWDSSRTNTYGANGGESLTKSVTNGGLETTVSYANASGPAQYQPTGAKDSGGTSRTYTYSGTGNPLSSTDADGAQAKVDYNADGTVAWAASPKDTENKTYYSYANAQTTRITPKTGSSLGVRDLTYDAFGRTRTATNGRGITATYSYDLLDRITETAFSDGTTVSYGYDAAGRNSTRVDPHGTTSYTYDQLGRMTARSNTAGGGTFTYGYNKASWLVSSASPAGGTITYGYDQSGELYWIRYPYQSETKLMIFYIDSQGRRTEAFMGTTPDKSSWVAHYKYSYNKNDQVTRVLAEQGTGPSSNSDVVDLTYCYKIKYDATLAPGGIKPGGDCTKDDNLPHLSKLQWKKDNLTGTVTEYSYTKGGRLDTVKISGNSTTTDFDYSYDKNGSRTGADNLATPDVPLTFNPENQITTAGYAYDAAGNLTARPGLSGIAYTAADQMKTVTKGGATYTYKHAGTDQNEMLAQTTPNGSYSYAYGRPSPQGVPTVESVTHDGKTADVLTDPATGQPLMLRTSAGMQSMYIYDGAPGSPITLITSEAYRAIIYDYDPYGVSTYAAGVDNLDKDQNPYVFASGIQDRTTGWVQFGARYYDPVTGAWTQMDTLDVPLDPINANRYAYVGGDPINNIDPTGRESCGQAVFLASINAGAFVAETGLLLGAVAAAPPTGGASLGVAGGVGIGLYFGTAYQLPFSIDSAVRAC